MRTPTTILALGAFALLPLATLSGCSAASDRDDAVSVAEAYFAALAKGDAATALTLTYPPDGDDSLLTDEVLARSNELAPMTGIKVSVPKAPEDRYSVDVVVKLQLGGKPVTIKTSVSDYGDDQDWLIHGLSTMTVEQFDGLGLTLNGQEVSGDTADVFPGTYEAGLTLDGFELHGETTITVTESYGSTIEKLDPVLDDDGVAAFRSAVRAEVDACVASTTLVAGCGLEIPGTLSDGTVLVDGTIQRSLPADTITTLESIVPQLSIENPTLAKGEFPGGVRVSAQCSKNGATGTCEILFAPALDTPSINMAKRPLTVLWD